jgi:hypothetical protein
MHLALNRKVSNKKRQHFKNMLVGLSEILGSHGGEDVDVSLLGCDAVWTCIKMPTFRRNILSPSSVLKTET